MPEFLPVALLGIATLVGIYFAVTMPSKIDALPRGDGTDSKPF